MPAEFQQAIDRTLNNTPGLFAFLDDILICTKGSGADHWNAVRSVLKKLNANNAGLNLDKCAFMLPEIHWLGYHLTSEGATPLTHKWTPDMQSALTRLKNAAIQVTQNKFFDALADTRITSKEGLGAVLEQRQHCSWVPIAFTSRFLNAAETHYSINELELLAVVWSVEHFKNYVFGRHFTIRTDHRALLSALKSNRGNKTTFSRLARWVDRLLPYSFEIVHVPGRDMGFADYLSRCPSGPLPPVSSFDQHFSFVACHRAIGPLSKSSKSVLKRLDQSDSSTETPHNFDRSLHTQLIVFVRTLRTLFHIPQLFIQR